MRCKRAQHPQMSLPPRARLHGTTIRKLAAHLAAGGAPLAVGVHDALGLVVEVALDDGLADAVARIVSELGGGVCRSGERIVGAGPDLLRQQVRLTAGEAAVARAALTCLHRLPQIVDRRLVLLLVLKLAGGMCRSSVASAYIVQPAKQLAARLLLCDTLTVCCHRHQHVGVLLDSDRIPIVFCEKEIHKLQHRRRRTLSLVEHHSQLGCTTHLASLS